MNFPIQPLTRRGCGYALANASHDTGFSKRTLAVAIPAHRPLYGAGARSVQRFLAGRTAKRILVEAIGALPWTRGRFSGSELSRTRVHRARALAANVGYRRT